jgi:hypothetical protein
MEHSLEWLMPALRAAEGFTPNSLEGLTLRECLGFTLIKREGLALRAVEGFTLRELEGLVPGKIGRFTLRKLEASSELEMRSASAFSSIPLSPIIPAHTHNSLVTPIIPALTRTPKGVLRRSKDQARPQALCFPYLRAVHPQLLCFPYLRKNRGVSPPRPIERLSTTRGRSAKE